MNVRTDRYRLSLYSIFAHLAKEYKLRWVVAHGSEGYPETIGRDLDILCDGIDNINLAVNLFKDAANKQSETKWIVEPHPIWGRRVLAISDNYEVAELHILYKLNSGLLDCPVEWDKVSDELFPHNDNVTYFKSKLMPLLGGSAKLERYTDDDVASMPWSIKRLYKKNLEKKRISHFDKFQVYFQLGNMNICRMYRNYKYSKSQKADIPIAATVPLVLIQAEKIQSIETELNEIFMKFVCGDNLSLKMINHNQTLQRFVYLTCKRKDITIDLEVLENPENCLENIVEAFSSYNNSRITEYTDYFEHRVTAFNK